MRWCHHVIYDSKFVVIVLLIFFLSIGAYFECVFDIKDSKFPVSIATGKELKQKKKEKDLISTVKQ